MMLESATEGRIATFFIITCLFLLSVIVMARQLGLSGYFSVNTIDTYTYASWSWQFNAALKEGIIYPRWLPLSFWGYGAPTFVLYPPLAFYMVAFFTTFTDSLLLAMNLAKFIALFMYGVTMFLLVREFYNDRIALLTAAFCIIFPYNIVQYYLMGTFSSSVSFMWFPVILLFACKFIKTERYQYLVYAGFCYGGLILTHLINAYMFTFVIIVFLCSASICRKAPRFFTAIPLILLMGFATSAAYLLPLIFEKRYFNLEAFIGKGYRYSDFFILPHHAINVFWKVYYDTFQTQTLFFLSIILAIVFLTRMVRPAFGQDVIMTNQCFIVIALASLYLLFGQSTFLWESIPFIKYVQFPVRWLNITTFATLVLSPAGLTALAKACNSKRKFAYVLLAMFLSLSMWDYNYVRHAPFYTYQELLPAKTVNWAFEHLPAGVDTGRIDENPVGGDFTLIQGVGDVKILRWGSAERIIHLVAQHASIVKIRIFNFPGWVAHIDRKPATMRTEAGTGAMLVAVPEGEHELTLHFEDTPIMVAGKMISAVTCILAIFMTLAVYVQFRLKNHKKRSC